LLLLTTACHEKERHLPGQPVRPPRTDRQVAEGWLQCIDCIGTYLTELKKLDPEKKDSIVQFLSSALLNGPDRANSLLIDRRLLRTWRANSAYAVRHQDTLKSTANDFVKHYRQSAEVIWRSRAATALGVLGTDSAMAALKRADSLPLDSISGSDSTISRAVKWALADKGRTGRPEAVSKDHAIPKVVVPKDSTIPHVVVRKDSATPNVVVRKDSVPPNVVVPKTPTCQEVAADPKTYLQTTVSLIGRQHKFTEASVDGRSVPLVVFTCWDSVAHAFDINSYFAFDPNTAKGYSGADSSVARKVTGLVYQAPMVPLGHQVARVMPYLKEVEVRAP
jgi:hypothetical protein